MEKVVHVLWRGPDDDPEAIGKELIERIGPALLAGPDGVAVHGLRITAEAPEGSWFRQGANADGTLLSATVSVWLDSIDERGPVDELIDSAGAVHRHAWLVTESIPRAYRPDERTWVDGERSVGLAITTIFDKAAGVSDADFFRIWHGEHTPLSFDIHPLWLYVRNAVARQLTAGGPPTRGIVYEAVPTTEDMLDLHRFFGSGGDKAALQANIERVNTHMATFADLANLQTTPTHEWILKTFST